MSVIESLVYLTPEYLTLTFINAFYSHPLDQDASINEEKASLIINENIFNYLFILYKEMMTSMDNIIYFEI